MKAICWSAVRAVSTYSRHNLADAAAYDFCIAVTVRSHKSKRQPTDQQQQEMLIRSGAARDISYMNPAPATVKSQLQLCLLFITTSVIAMVNTSVTA